MTSPFSNGTEFEIWEARWCARCVHDAEFRAGDELEGCSILAEALVGETPKEWSRTGPSDYECAEFAL